MIFTKTLQNMLKKGLILNGYELERLLSKENDKKSHWPNQR